MAELTLKEKIDLYPERIRNETEKIQNFIKSFNSVEQLDQAVDILQTTIEKGFLLRSELEKAEGKFMEKIEKKEVFTIDQLENIKEISNFLQELKTEISLFIATINHLEMEIVKKIPKIKEKFWVSTGRYLIKIEKTYLTEIKTI